MSIFVFVFVNPCFYSLLIVHFKFRISSTVFLLGNIHVQYVVLGLRLKIIIVIIRNISPESNRNELK